MADLTDGVVCGEDLLPFENELAWVVERKRNTSKRVTTHKRSEKSGEKGGQRTETERDTRREETRRTVASSVSSFFFSRSACASPLSATNSAVSLAVFLYKVSFQSLLCHFRAVSSCRTLSSTLSLFLISCFSFFVPTSLRLRSTAHVLPLCAF